ncbi:MAG: DPP IV N-terminal domain-containing protein, partial [Pseudomonadales bacterium]|nr:DPP IV N-terminal domain-containing protein [Pseudomonadales bacterium]
PDLSGATPVSVRFSPDGSRLAWLQGADDDPLRLNLWEYRVDTGHARLAIDATTLATRALSDEEKARRERLRITQAGIVEYFWHPTRPAVAFGADGVLCLYDLSTDEMSMLTAADSFATDVKFSPDGEYLAYVKAHDLFILSIESGKETRLTFDGSETVSSGIAEFIAAEEMHRYDGYWWSPDSQRIAFIRVDESPVALSYRFEIDADDFRLYPQRYPYAGQDNARVQLGVVEIDGDTRWPQTTAQEDDYLARVTWMPDSQLLAVQVQSRDQKRLDLIVSPVSGGEPARLCRETSDTWINLHDCCHPLKSSPDIVWCSARTGFAHLYRLSPTGEATPLTSGQWCVKRLVAIDETRDALFFEGFADTPLEKHLYRTSLAGDGEITRLTQPGYSHQVDVDRGAAHFVDRFSSAASPPEVRLCRIDGTATTTISRNAFDLHHPFYAFRDAMGDISFGTLHAADGQVLHYRTVRPRRPGKYPLILSVYGGPGVQRVTNEWLSPWHHHMASRGYGIIQLDNRGTANRGVAFESPIHGMLGHAEVEDQLLAVEFARSLDWVDPDRIGVFGHSYGGYMTLMLMMKSRDFRCGISVAPVTDWALYDTHYTERYLGKPAENPDGYASSAVLGYATALRGHLLMIHGMADDNVLFTHSTKLYKVLQDANIDFEIMNYPGAKHGLAGRATNIHRYTLMDRFLDAHLKN